MFSNVLHILNRIKYQNNPFLTGQTQKMNLFQSITSALDNALAKDPTAGMLCLLVCFAFHQLHFCIVNLCTTVHVFLIAFKLCNVLLLHFHIKQSLKMRYDLKHVNGILADH